jgi:hypothetical protein
MALMVAEAIEFIETGRSRAIGERESENQGFDIDVADFVMMETGK